MSEALDTNVLVRLATRDDEAQFRKAEKLIRARFPHSSPAWISLIVVVEYTWVLAKLYQYGRDEIVETLTALTETDCFQVEDRNLVRAAIHVYARGKADFADCLIAVRNKDQGAMTTHTFDRKAAKIEGFQAIP